MNSKTKNSSPHCGFTVCFGKLRKNANREGNRTGVLQYVLSQSITPLGFYSMFCSWGTRPAEVPKGDRGRSGRKVADPNTTHNTKVVHFGRGSGRESGRGRERGTDEDGGVGTVSLLCAVEGSLAGLGIASQLLPGLGGGNIPTLGKVPSTPDS